MDATFWAFISLLLFLALIAYLKVPGMIGKALDERADRIRNELDEARKLRDEATQLLAEYQRKRQEAEKEAADLLASAEREAAAIVAEAKAKTDDYVARRTVLAEQKIAQAERDAISEVHSRAVDVAIAAATTVLGSAVDTTKNTQLFKDSIAQMKEKLN